MPPKDLTHTTPVQAVGEAEVEKILSESESAPEQEDSFVSSLSQTSRKALAAFAYKDVIEMRRQWSNVLLFLIGAIVLYDLWFSTALGSGWIVFPNEKLIAYFILENLAKIAGLAYIVVNFLFDKTKNY
ncbi:MAG: hypothetical protein PHV99_00770 [Candidatus Pacebacteria bacterium]|nr:hypothetical protein [Candidatus Paceibacterota bacterium]